jgi:uncharacterized protein YdaU (DUF1376 family)
MSVKPDTWMPLFVGDYLKATGRLTCEQHGAYLQLILDYWVNGAPPDDDAVLARIVGLDARTWRRHRPIIERYFIIAGGQWRHKRVDQELAGASERSGKAAAKARAAAEARWERERQKEPEDDAPGNAPSMLGALHVAPAEQCLSNALHLPPVTLPSEERTSEGPHKRAGRLSPTWAPGPEDTAYALSQGFGDRAIATMGENFRDYWTSKAGRDAAKLDWRATWRTWVRREVERRPAAAPRRVGFV